MAQRPELRSLIERPIVALENGNKKWADVQKTIR